METELYDTSEILNACKLSLGYARGAYYPNKNYGSLIKTITKTLTDEYLLDYARQALADLDGVRVKSAEQSDDGVTFTLMINDMERQVQTEFD
ncbi:MAG: hypothetical protein LIO62_03455 [Clostridiales bacterium]|nr:hypothetical protein [Clostridiales bacterium]